MASLSGEQLALLGRDEASVAVRLAQLTCNGFPASNGKPEDKEDKAKEKKAAKDSRKAAAQGRKDVLKQATTVKKPQLSAKVLECEVDVGTVFNVAELAGSADLPDSSGAERERFYLTTAINYTNGNPHIGHAYEAITSDCISRYHRMYGRRVFFQTGTDEHGQKIANAAEAQGKQPIDICDHYAGNFQELNKRLLISNDFYIRTTMPDHHREAQKLWSRCADAGDIYLGNYEGWYDEREETFISEKDAELTDFKDAYGSPLKRMSEASYFFKMGKHQEWLIQYIQDNPAFVQPEDKRAFILARLAEPLNDLSISRTTFKWGIPVPEGFEKDHVMYVWFDALSNYISSIHALDPSHELSAFWPASCHIIGKDITWFHCVIWPCMLKSAGLALPKAVFAHGFISGSDGRKMSKSLGNVVDPHELCESYPVDSFRWYMCRECTFGADLSFSKDSLVAMHNADLCDTLGNLVHRAFSLMEKYSGGKIPVAQENSKYCPFDLAVLRTEVERLMQTFNMQQALHAVMCATRDTNKFLTDQAPWLIKGDGPDVTAQRIEIVRVTLDAVYCLAHFLAPAIPAAAHSIFTKCGTPPQPIQALRANFKNLQPGTPTTVGRILFNKLEPPSSTVGATSAVPPYASPVISVGGKQPGGAPAAPPLDGRVSPTIAHDDASKDSSSSSSKKEKGGGRSEGSNSGGNKGKGGKATASKATDDAEPTVDQDDFTKMDIRVGQITKVWNHPDSDKLYCEEIECGESQPRSVASGLRAHHTLDEMQDRLICVVCNLKPAKLAGFVSEGMVLAAQGSDGKVELVRPPSGSVVGERLTVAGLTGEPLNANAVKKRKAWETLAPSLTIDAQHTACFKGQPISTSAGVCTADTVTDGRIS